VAIGQAGATDSRAKNEILDDLLNQARQARAQEQVLIHRGVPDM
jgi:hypothetical protein